MRTWTLVDTLLLGGGTLNADGLIAVDETNDLLYTFTSGITPHVFSWDGANEIDLSGATFNGGAGSSAKGIVFFKDDLYLLWFDPTEAANDRQRVYKYSGSGTTWNAVYNHTDGTTDGGKLKMACDSARIAIQVQDSTEDRLIASTDGSSWATQTVTGLGDTPGEMIQLFGTEHYLGYSEILAFAADLSQTIAYTSGNNWDALGGAPGSSFLLGGYGDGYYFAGDAYSTPAYKLSRSTDWGVTPLNPSGAINDGFYSQCIATISDPDIMMYRYGNDDQAWTYNGTKFIEDGTIGSGDLKAFFTFGDNTIYALSSDGTVYLADSSGLWYSQGGIPGSVLVST